MEVRKSNGKTENFSTRKLTSIIKKVYKSAGIELSEEKPEEIINIFLDKKRQIEMANADIKKAHQTLD